MKQIVVYWPFKGSRGGKPLFKLAVINFRQNDLKEILDSYNTLRNTNFTVQNFVKLTPHLFNDIWDYIRNSEFDEDYAVIGWQDIAKDEYQKRLTMPITQKNV